MIKYQRRYGVEIELSRQLLCVNNEDKRYGPAWNEVNDLIQRLYSEAQITRGWRLKVDTSCGGEVVSPILKGPSGMSDVARICKGINEIAKRYGLPASDAECGLHIHIDAQNIKPQQVSNLFALLHAAEPIIYAMYTARNLEYCAPISLNMKLASRARDWSDIRDIWYRPSNNVKNPAQTYTSQFINGNNSGEMYDGTRYHGFNIHCFWRQGTVEFRYAGGTTDPLQIYAYYLMCQAMMEKAMASKPNTSEDIKSMDFNTLVTHYKVNGRFRKMIRNFVKDCSIPAPAVRMIMSLIRKSNPHLLRKADSGKETINQNNNMSYSFNLDGEILDGSGRPVTSRGLTSRRHKESKTVDVALDYTMVNGDNIALRSISPDHVITTPIYYRVRYQNRNDELLTALDEFPKVDKSMKYVSIDDGGN
jgi:hypothetical protein